MLIYIFANYQQQITARNPTDMQDLEEVSE